MSPASSYRPAEDPYPAHRCRCLHLDVQHTDSGCPWCDCERFVRWDEDAR